VNGDTQTELMDQMGIQNSVNTASKIAKIMEVVPLGAFILFSIGRFVCVDDSKHWRPGRIS
jgi:hypothetical protein